MHAYRSLSLRLTSLALLGSVALAGGQQQSCPAQQQQQQQGAACSQSEQGCASTGEKATTVAFAPLSADESAHVHELFGKVLRGELLQPAGEAGACAAAEGSSKNAQKAAWNAYATCPIAALAKELAAKPAGWSEIKGELATAFTCEQACPLVKRRLVELMSMTGCEVAQGVAAELYESSPKSFADDHLLALAERGSKPAWHALMQRWEKKQIESALPVALYALHNDEVCEVTTATLRAAAADAREAHYSGSKLNQALACSLALAKHGETEPLASTQLGAHQAVLAALDANQLDQARQIALQAKFFAGVSEWKSAFALAFLDQNVEAYCKEAAAEYPTADDVFELIESITPID